MCNDNNGLKTAFDAIASQISGLKSEINVLRRKQFGVLATMWKTAQNLPIPLTREQFMMVQSVAYEEVKYYPDKPEDWSDSLKMCKVVAYYNDRHYRSVILQSDGGTLHRISNYMGT